MWGWGEGKEGRNMIDCCRPLGVEVYRLEDGPLLNNYWKPPQFPAYRGIHGLKMPHLLERTLIGNHASADGENEVQHAK